VPLITAGVVAAIQQAMPTECALAAVRWLTKHPSLSPYTTKRAMMAFAEGAVDFVRVSDLTPYKGAPVMTATNVVGRTVVYRPSSRNHSATFRVLPPGVGPIKNGPRSFFA
jgi:hypothetical protein